MGQLLLIALPPRVSPWPGSPFATTPGYRAQTPRHGPKGGPAATKDQTRGCSTYPWPPRETNISWKGNCRWRSRSITSSHFGSPGRRSSSWEGEGQGEQHQLSASPPPPARSEPGGAHGGVPTGLDLPPARAARHTLTSNLPMFCSSLTLLPERYCQARPRSEGGIPFWHRSRICTGNKALRGYHGALRLPGQDTGQAQHCSSSTTSPYKGTCPHTTRNRVPPDRRTGWHVELQLETLGVPGGELRGCAGQARVRPAPSPQPCS